MKIKFFHVKKYFYAPPTDAHRLPLSIEQVSQHQSMLCLPTAALSSALHFMIREPFVCSTKCTQQRQDEGGQAMERCAKMCKKST